jgi:hypothetical protein
MAAVDAGETKKNHPAWSGYRKKDGFDPPIPIRGNALGWLEPRDTITAAWASAAARSSS